MDTTDIKIINILQKNSRTPIKNISQLVSLSAPAVKERINKMIASGLIREFTTVLEPDILGKTLTAFIFLTLRHPDKSQHFHSIIQDEQGILACYYLTGDFDYMVHIVTNDTHSLERVISKLRNSHEFSTTKTSIVLSTIKEKHSISP